MKAINTENLSQNEAQTLEAKLGLHAAHLRGLLALAESESIAPPALTKGDTLGNIRVLVSHISELEHRLDGNAPDFHFQFSTVSADGGTRPATANPATRSGGANHNTLVSQPGGKLSMTEQVLAAKGCKTLTEANEKFAKQSALGRCDD